MHTNRKATRSQPHLPSPCRAHVPTVESKIAPHRAQSETFAASHAASDMVVSIPCGCATLHSNPALLCRCEALAKVNLGTDVAISGILPFLHRRRDLPSFAGVCRAWNTLSKLSRATSPSCAVDVRLAVEFGLHEHARRDSRGGACTSRSPEYDGDYILLHRGVGPAMSVYCHNVLSDRPTEFISLPSLNGHGNYSHAPEGGSCRGTSVTTTFFKVRFDPWSLTVKTDDYTFAETVGGPLVQTYWNGERSVTLTAVPFATARDSIQRWGRPDARISGWVPDPEATGDRPLMLPPSCGRAMIDLRRTGFGVPAVLDGTAFGTMGCDPVGRVSVAEVDGRPIKSGHSEEPTPAAAARAWQRIHLSGGGYAGRLAPRADRTLDEGASFGDYDDEGRNGGWVLPLAIVDETTVGASPDSGDLGRGWFCFSASPVTKAATRGQQILD